MYTLPVSMCGQKKNSNICLCEVCINVFCDTVKVRIFSTRLDFAFSSHVKITSRYVAVINYKNQALKRVQKPMPEKNPA